MLVTAINQDGDVGQNCLAFHPEQRTPAQFADDWQMALAEMAEEDLDYSLDDVFRRLFQEYGWHSMLVPLPIVEVRG
jgi:hypothetical protein